MKKIIINISDFTYEKLRFESIMERKSIPDLIQERILYKNFHIDVEKAFHQWMEIELNKIIGE